MPLLVAGFSDTFFPIRPTFSSIAANMGSMYGGDWQLGTALRETPRDESQQDETGKRQWPPLTVTRLCIVLLLFCKPNQLAVNCRHALWSDTEMRRVVV